MGVGVTAMAVLCAGTVSFMAPNVAQSQMPSARDVDSRGVVVLASPADGDRALGWGDPYFSGTGLPDVDDSLPAPVQAGANTANTWRTDWGALDGGSVLSCGVAGDDSAYCWGSNDYGEFGSGTLGDSRVPVRVVAGANTSHTWVSVTAGGASFACGIGGNANAYCWGNNYDRQLGSGTTDDSSSVPLAVQGGPSAWTALSAGLYHVCALGSDRKAYCWGAGGEGRLGNGSNVTRNGAVAVVGGPAVWASVSAGYGHSCGLGDDSRAYCWGGARRGELGNGSRDDTWIPVPVARGDNAGGTWKRVAAGYLNSCGIGGDDLAYCWGWNVYGQLGSGSLDDSLGVPVRVALPAGVKVRMLSMDAAASHVCVLSTDARVFCWGNNGTGQLGNGSHVLSRVPVEVRFSPDLATGTPKLIAVGSSTSLAVSRFGPDPDPDPGPNPDPDPDPGPNPDPSPLPAPVFPPSAPREAIAEARDASAAVSWQAPESSGSFPVTHFQATATPGGQGCLVPAAQQSCVVTGLANGTAYSFTVRALNGAGWGPISGASNAVTPQATAAKTLLIAGSRGTGSDAERVFVTGRSTGLMGAQAVPWVRLSGQVDFVAGSSAPIIGPDGSFTWRRKTGKRIAVYFVAGAVRSNAVSVTAK